MSDLSLALGGVSLPLIKGKSPDDGIQASFKEVDKLNQADFAKAAAALKLSVEPFMRSKLRPVLLGHVQLEWHKAHSTQLSADEKTKLQQNQERRIQRYTMELEDSKSAGADLVAKIGVRAKSPAKPRQANVYQLTEKGKKAELHGQKYVLQQTLLAAQGTAKELFEKQKKFDGIKPSSDKNVQFYVNQFVKEGLAEAIGQIELPNEAPKTVAQKDAEKKAAAPTSKKK